MEPLGYSYPQTQWDLGDGIWGTENRFGAGDTPLPLLYAHSSYASLIIVREHLQQQHSVARSFFCARPPKI